MKNQTQKKTATRRTQDQKKTATRRRTQDKKRQQLEEEHKIME
jgi:hypothetical protein